MVNQIRAFLVCYGLFFITGCSVVSNEHVFRMPQLEKDGKSVVVWPKPPDVPRYAFIGHIYGESSSAEPGSIKAPMERFLAALVGLQENAESLINLVQPQQIVTDNNGRIYVTDSARQAVFVFDEKLSRFFVWDEANTSIPFLSPVGITFANDSIWVTDSELSLVYQIKQNGELIKSFGRDVLNRPTGIAYDAVRQRLFVADTADSKIRIFNIEGELIDEWGSFGRKEGEFNRPTFLAYRGGRLYVADSLNARIQVFDSLGNSVQSLGHRGLYVGDFTRPKGITVDSDSNLYVAESYYDHVLIYNKSGELLMSLGGSGIGAGKFMQPTGIWVDPNDRVFVSDMLNSRISIFQYLGGD